MASQLLLSLCLVATLAVIFAAASGDPSPSGLIWDQLPSSNKGLNLDKVAVGSGGSSCDHATTKEEALLEARDECCNGLGKHGRCVCSAAKQVFDSVQSLHLCDNYNIDACSSSSDPAASGGGCSLDNLGSTAEQCSKAVKILEDLASLKKSSSSDDDCLKEALVKLGVDSNFHGVVEKKLLSPAGN